MRGGCMTKLYRVVAYVLNLNGDMPDKKTVVSELTCRKYPEFITVTELQETVVGEWHDDHPLNISERSYDSYFPEIYERDVNKLSAELAQLRAQYVQEVDKNSLLQNQVDQLKEDLRKVDRTRKFAQIVKKLVDEI